MGIRDTLTRMLKGGQDPREPMFRTVYDSRGAFTAAMSAALHGMKYEHRYKHAVAGGAVEIYVHVPNVSAVVKRDRHEPYFEYVLQGGVELHAGDVVIRDDNCPLVELMIAPLANGRFYTGLHWSQRQQEIDPSFWDVPYEQLVARFSASLSFVKDPSAMLRFSDPYHLAPLRERIVLPERTVGKPKRRSSRRSKRVSPE